MTTIIIVLLKEEKSFILLVLQASVSVTDLLGILGQKPKHPDPCL